MFYNMFLIDFAKDSSILFISDTNTLLYLANHMPPQPYRREEEV